MVDVREAAELVHRTPETIRRWAWTHRVEAVKHGNRLMFRRDDLVRLGQAGDQQPPARSLTAWVEQVRAANTTGAPGGTSRDLVLEDRAGRQAGTSGAGR
ncbi:MAG: helix-turn-helix domain-containing protein [Actinomycetes bacterium]